MLYIFKWICSFCKLSYYAHHNQFDLIRFPNGYNTQNVRKCWLISLVLYCLTALYGIFGLECESRPVCAIDWAALPTSPYINYHQMFPKAIWIEVNFLVSSMLLMCIGGWAVFLNNPPIERRYLILSDEVSGQEKKDEFAQMCQFRERIRKAALAIEMTIFLYGHMFIYAHVFYINANYNINLTSALFWGLFSPIHLYYNVNFLYSVPCYVILASRYVTIQQKTLANKLADLNLKLSKLHHHHPELAKRRLARQLLWLQYLCVNNQLCDLCGRLREYARFWSPFLTLIFGAFISFQCYMFYIYLFTAEISSALKFVLLLAVLFVVFNEFVLITECASVVQQFKRITLHNRAFYQNYRRTEACMGKVLDRNLAKAESLQDSRLFHSYAFRLFGNYRITTKSFHMIVSYISILFLFIVKSKY